MIALITVVCTIVAVLASVVAIWLARKDRNSERTEKQMIAEINAMVKAALNPLENRMNNVEARVSPESQDHARLLTKGMISESLRPIEKQLSSLDTKVELFWGSLATEMAKILHQPDPRRHHIDALLESFMEGTLNTDERLELRRHLVYIRNWEPGKPSDYPIHPGEQVAAAILLRTMDNVKSEAP